MGVHTNQARIRCLSLLMLTFFGLLFSACTSKQSTEGEQISTTKTATSQPTQTDLLPTLKNIPSATPELQPVTDVTIKYMNALDEMPTLNGKLAFRMGRLFYLYDFATKDEILLGDLYWYKDPFYDFFSPDRETLLMNDAKGQDYLVDTNGTIVQQLNHVSLTSETVGWLDNDRLIVTDDWDNKDYYRLKFTTLMNIHSNEIVPLEPLYPDFGTLATNWGNNLAIYHPQLPLAVYPAAINRPQTINIYDLEKQQVQVEIPAFIWETEKPRWSPDGKYLLLAGVLNNTDPDKQKEIYLFDTEGRNLFTTLFANHTPKEEFKGFSWSPNSQKIAFWINDYYGPIYQLAILDVNSGIVTQYDIFTHGGNSAGPPIWSPDSQFVAVEQAEDFKAIFVTTTLLHLDSGNAFDFSTDPDLMLDGWVK